MTLTEEQHVLLIDDDNDVLDAYYQMLKQAGYQVVPCNNPQLAVEMIPDEWPGAVISDVYMPQLSGLSLLEYLLNRDKQLPVLLITGHGDVPMAVEAVKKGAYDFLEKPVMPEKLLRCLQQALKERRQLIQRRRWQRSQLAENLIGVSGWSKQLRERLQMLAETRMPAFFYGELGTGRTLAARHLHQLSMNRHLPLVVFDAASDRAETFEEHCARVRQGTLIVRNIEQLNHQQQYFLAQQQSDEERAFRLLAIGQQCATRSATQQKILPELYYQFSMTQIECVPLSKRPGDIEPLFRHYLKLACQRLNREYPTLSDTFSKSLYRRSWSGNIKELRNAAELFAVGVMPIASDEKEWVSQSATPTPLDDRIEQYECQIITEALDIHQGRINDVAEYLQVPRKKLYLRMKKYGIDKKDYRF
ncbi:MULTISPECIES: two-component system response regulator PgtA [unclassified Brenneria]|uniref:two-component system response regulator PgtA n=1 Tax=unclassified Brenneria TaxID=2634434 RepID=UPI0015555D06|nr:MULTISPECIES: sigma-54 dependent transcriptional regulator [unclassified Brenneria]MBJ7221834.1 sigma-54-dependent Fis family transcriptional regulator [Brenneria sp. L3-3C-1]MEE3643077.1 sigma-54 dependent transcriptional regulator [Brenneria sp. L3_3C_1]MEE3650737.1 sigma-54 dependent transcriptional regulator [Brenneria sp. HEZEL_4_2_4]NPD00692.1 sigma-54-dependent Fis family transcriptional regulator [Brenneria sp. hezel4-2-4]